MIFDTNVQELKYRVLKAVAEHAYAGTMDQAFREIPMEIVPGKEATMRCCVYKERAIVVERVKLAMGGERERPGAIEVIPIACDECPRSSYTVSDYCRGCIAHRCVTNCPVGAISIVDHRAQIDPAKCIQCGKCASACPYNAIYSYQRPCEAACKIKAIGVGEEGEAVIDEKRCISCGACVNQCPFGAIVDKSYILDAIQMLQESLAGAEKPMPSSLPPSPVSFSTPPWVRSSPASSA